MTISDRALNAISARRHGRFDDPDLMALGELLPDPEADVIRIKRKALEDIGASVGPRDPRINRNYAGRFMVAEGHDESELPTDDGSNGPWCIVGDDLDWLINEAFDILVCDIYSEV